MNPSKYKSAPALATRSVVSASAPAMLPLPTLSSTQLQKLIALQAFFRMTSSRVRLANLRT